MAEAQRAPVRDIPRIASQITSPVAQPIDNFAPAPVKNRGLADLAEGVATLDQGLSSWLNYKAAKENDAQSQRAKADFYANNQQGYAEAVRTGKIPATASPYYTRAYKFLEGDVLGQRLTSQAIADFQTSDVRNAEDPNAVYDWVAKWVGGKVSTTDQDVLRGLTPHLDQITGAVAGQYDKERAANVYGLGKEAGAAKVATTIDSADDYALANSKPTDYDGIWNTILATREERFNAGLAHDDYDAAAIAVITAKAIEKQDPKLLELLDRKLPGKDYGLADTQAGLKAKLEAENALATKAASQSVQEEKAAEKERKEGKARYTSAILTALDKDPNVDIPDETIKAWEKYDPEARENLRQWRKVRKDTTSTEDDQDVLALQQQLYNGGGIEVIQDGIAHGVIKKYDTWKKMTDYLDTRNKVGKDLLSGDTYDNAYKTIAGLLTPNALFTFDGKPTYLTPDALKATDRFTSMLLDWGVKNPNATLAEKEKAIGEIRDQITKDIVKPTGSANFVYTPGGVTAQAQKDTPQEQPAPTSGVDPGLQRFIDSAQPQTKDIVEKAARQAGVDPSVYWQRIYKRAMDASSGANNPVVNPTPSPNQIDPSKPAPLLGQSLPLDNQSFTPGDTASQLQAGGGLDIQPDPQLIQELSSQVEQFMSTPQGQQVLTGVRGLLGLITHAEAKGNYNVLQGGQVAPLTSMTINDVLSLGKGSGGVTTAKGGMQIINSTLKGLVRSLGLTGNEVFDENMQNRLGLALLRGRGLDAYLSGQLTAEQFAHNISQEWAALPTPTTGKSYYAGDGINAATVPLDRVLAVIKTLRNQNG